MHNIDRIISVQMMKWTHNVQNFYPRGQEGIKATTAWSCLRPHCQVVLSVLFCLFISKLEAFKSVQRDQSLVNTEP